MIEWLDDFYGDPDMRSTMLRNFLPLFTSYVTEATGGPVAASFVQALAESYVDRHLGSSRAQLQEVVKGSDDPLAALTARFDEWEEKRPEKVARNELVRSANAASVEKMREAGVTKMVWRASGGKTCPFCTELDGTIISVTGTFFEAGDTLNPEGATAPINFESSLGHPPVHQGCVCSVEAVEETETAGEPDRVVAEPLDDTERERIQTRLDKMARPNWGKSDPRMDALARRQGYDALPHVVTRAELDRFVARGETEFFRGIPSKEYAEQYRTGSTVYQGQGAFGNGTYSAVGGRGRANAGRRGDIDQPGLTSLDLAREFAGSTDGSVVRGTLRADARVLTATPDELQSLDLGGFKSPTEWATAQGYDAVIVRGGSRTYIESSGLEEFGDQMVILNRSAVRVQNEDVPWQN